MNIFSTLSFCVGSVIVILAAVRMLHYGKEAKERRINRSFYVVACLEVGVIIFISMFFLFLGMIIDSQMSSEMFTFTNGSEIIFLVFCPFSLAVGGAIGVGVSIWKIDLERQMVGEKKT